MTFLSFVLSCVPTVPDAPGASVIVRDLLRRVAPDRFETGGGSSCTYKVLQKSSGKPKTLHACMRCSRSRLQEESPYTHVWGAHFPPRMGKSGARIQVLKNPDLKTLNSAKIVCRSGQLGLFSDNLKKVVAAGKVSPFWS